MIVPELPPTQPQKPPPLKRMRHSERTHGASASAKPGDVRATAGARLPEVQPRPCGEEAAVPPAAATPQDSLAAAPPPNARERARRREARRAAKVAAKDGVAGAD